MNRGDVFARKGLSRAGFVVIVSNDAFSAVTGHPVVVRVSDRPDLTETGHRRSRWTLGVVLGGQGQA